MSKFVVIMPNDVLEALKNAVTKAYGKELCVRSDFDAFASKLESCAYGQLSSTTLRRFWGYQVDQQTNPSVTSLNILSRYCGYDSFASFKKFYEDNVDEEDTQSYFTHGRRVEVEDIEIGQLIRLIWNPGRCVLIEFLGGNKFHVLESLNSKLTPGITFECPLFIDGEPLTLIKLERDGERLGDYICGKHDGVRFSFVKDRKD